AQREAGAARRRCAAAGVEPRPGDAEGWPLSVVGEAACAVTGWTSFEPRHSGVSSARLRWWSAHHRAGASIGVEQPARTGEAGRGTGYRRANDAAGQPHRTCGTA